MKSLTLQGTGVNNTGSITTTGGYDLGALRETTLHVDTMYVNPNTDPVVLGRFTLDNGVTLTLGNGGTAPITVKLIRGVAGGEASYVVINSVSTVLVSETIGVDIGTLTITNSGGTTFAGAVTTGTSVVLTDTTGTIAFNGALTTPTLTTANKAYSLGLNATGTSITNAVNFLNTGTLALGSVLGTQTYTGGLNAAGATKPTMSTLKGTINTTNTAMVFGPVTLGDNTTLTTNATSSAGSMILGAVTLGNYTLTLQTGIGSGTSAANITGTTVSGLGALALQNIGGTASFSGAVSPATLTVASSVNNAAFTGTASTITNAVTFSNTGTLTLGQDGGVQTYTGGLIATAPSTVTLNGTINTTNTALTLNAFTLGSAVTLNANSSDSTGLIKVGTITGASQNLTFASGYISAYSGSSIAIASSVNNVTLTAATGTVNHQITFSNTGTLTLGTAGGTQTYAGGLIATGVSGLVTLKGTINTTNTAMVFGPVTLGDNTTLTTNATSSAGSMILGAVTLGNYTLTLQTGTVSGTSAANITGTTVSGLGALALQNIGGTASFSGAVSPATLTVASSVNNAAFTGTASTITNAVTFSNTGTLTLGQDGGVQTLSLIHI